VLSVAVGWRKVGEVGIYTTSSKIEGVVGKERPTEDETAEACVVNLGSVYLVFGGFRWWCGCQVCGDWLVIVSDGFVLWMLACGNAGDCVDVVLGPWSLP
jgi:hypothetical protein